MLSFKEFSLFFLISTNLSASAVSPTTQNLFFLSLRLSGIEFSLTKGMFYTLNPLLAKYIDVGVLLVLLTPNKIISDLLRSSDKLPSS